MWKLFLQMFLPVAFLRLMATGEGEGGGDDRGDNWSDEQRAESDAAEAAAAETARLAKLAEADKDDKVEETDEEKTAREAAEAAAKATDDGKKAEEDKTRIPVARHKTILDAERAKREAVELELSKYRQAGAIADVNKDIGEAETALLKLEADYAKAIVDGSAEKAAGIMTQIRKSEREIAAKTTTMAVKAAEARAVESARYETTVDRIEEQFPSLNPDHADFDNAKAAEVVEMKEAFQAKGYTPSAALQKAVKYVMPPENKKQEEVLKVEPKVDAAAIEKARKEAAVQKALEANGKTPPSTTKVGADSDKKGGGAVTAADALKMPYKDFASLDENTLARMRGDLL